MGLLYWAEVELPLRTGRLCLDFANTVDWHAGPQPGEWLHSYADLVDWARRVGLLNAADADRLARSAAARPEAAQAVLDRAITLREAIFHTLAAHAHRQAPNPADLALLNAELPRALAQAQLQRGNSGYTLAWDQDAEALDDLLRPIAYSAANLMATPELLERVGQCADEQGCGWLFLDLTKNRSRRWCDMKDCGNRAKARRHYARKKAQAAG